mmetsp:Transcript_5627/g.6920  ORF Transcript_5627/g.6920 Transcript_5627/m.6920 type:complete len:170 (-) Transcript_5627:106-615(-)
MNSGTYKPINQIRDTNIGKPSGCPPADQIAACPSQLSVFRYLLMVLWKEKRKAIEISEPTRFRRTGHIGKDLRGDLQVQDFQMGCAPQLPHKKPQLIKVRKQRSANAYVPPNIVPDTANRRNSEPPGVSTPDSESSNYETRDLGPRELFCFLMAKKTEQDSVQRLQDKL